MHLQALFTIAYLPVQDHVLQLYDMILHMKYFLEVMKY